VVMVFDCPANWELGFVGLHYAVREDLSGWAASVSIARDMGKCKGIRPASLSWLKA